MNHKLKHANKGLRNYLLILSILFLIYSLGIIFIMEIPEFLGFLYLVFSFSYPFLVLINGIFFYIKKNRIKSKIILSITFINAFLQLSFDYLYQFYLSGEIYGKTESLLHFFLKYWIIVIIIEFLILNFIKRRRLKKDSR